MQSSEIRVGDKVYRYKKPVLGLLRKWKHFERFITKPETFGEMVGDEEEYKKFTQDWPAFAHDVLENADGELMLEKILPLDAMGVIAGFFVYGANAMTVSLTSLGSVTPKESASPPPTQSTSSSTALPTETSPKAGG